MLRRMYSWLLGYTIGQVRYDMRDNSHPYRYNGYLKMKIAEYKWTGFTWKKMGYRIFLFDGREWYPSLTLVTSLLGEA